MDKAPGTRAARYGIRCTALVALAALLATGPASWGVWALSALSPHVAVISSVALRSVGLVAACSGPMIVLMALRRRWFCRYLCPVGLIVETCSRAGFLRKLNGAALPPIGQWLALASLGGALLGCPLFLWLDPLAIFSGAAGVLHAPLTAASAAPAAGLASIVVLSLIAPHLWCVRLCPLGGTQEMLADLKRLLARPVRSEGSPPKADPHLGRRSVLCAGAGAAWALAVPRLFRASPPVLRPPGAPDEMHFKALCVRCGNCVRACPSRIIERQLTGDVSGFLTPVVHFPTERNSQRYCLETCHACTRSCPTGAIERLSLESKNRRPIGLAVIDMPACLIAADQTCAVCVDACPQEAISLRFHEETYTNTVEVDPRRCNGCGACLLVCPVEVIAVQRV